MDTYNRALSWRCGPYLFDLQSPVIMGILNATPDSFSDGGENVSVSAAIAHATKMYLGGADIIDVGGESTRPGAVPCSIEEEAKRVLPLVKSLNEKGIPVSIDTRHAQIAKSAVKLGACVINDVTGFSSKEMQEVAQHCFAGLMVMHMQGNPQTMNDQPKYVNVVNEVETFLLSRARELMHLGIDADRISVDPGIGFGKSFEHNHALYHAASRLASNGFPLVCALSRKSYVGSLSGVKTTKLRDGASQELELNAIDKGASIVRTHNPVRLASQLRRNEAEHIAFIALGSNMGNREANLREALERLCVLPCFNLLAVSSIYETRPVDCLPGTQSYCNAVIACDWKSNHPSTVAAKQLLEVLLKTEANMGRTRPYQNAPRPIDLDLLSFDDIEMKSEKLTLPHPRMFERDFVMTPLKELSTKVHIPDRLLKHPEMIKTQSISAIVWNAFN